VTLLRVGWNLKCEIEIFGNLLSFAYTASSQSSIESIPRTTSKIAASTSLITTRIKRGTVTTKSSESKSSSATTASSSRKRENGNGSDASRRIHRVCSRERMQKSNASSSESDLPNSSAEAPRRPRRTKVVKHQRGEDEKKSISSRTTTIETSSSPKKYSSSGKGMRKEFLFFCFALRESFHSVHKNS
jgi:hypothetical protein